MFNGTKYKGKRVASKNGSSRNNRTNNGANDNVKNASGHGVSNSSKSGKQSVSADAMNGASKKASANTKQTGRKAMTARKTLLIVLMVLFLSLATLTVSLGFYVDSLDTVFPNTYLDGVNISGMTLPQVTDFVTRQIESLDFANVTVFIDFYEGERLSLSCIDAGFSFEANALAVEDMANEIFMIGRESGFLRSERGFIRSLMETTEISLADLDQSIAIMFDYEIVRAIVDEHINAYNSALVDDALTINSDAIVVVKGSRLEYIDPDVIFDMVMTALYSAVNSQEDVFLQYTPTAVEEEVEDVDIDVLFSLIHTEPVNSVYDPATFSTTESSDGLTFDLEDARARLNNAVRGEEVIIPLITIPPEVSQEQLDELLFRDVLGERSTNIAGTSNRLHNVVISSAAIHEIILNPGDVFSFNRVVGRRTPERGFRMAPGFVGGRLVDQVGGGICQTSSTLYVAALKAQLDIVERRAHGQPISYLPLGQDATVAYAANIDFRFRNNTDFPIRLEMIVSGRTLTARIYGTGLHDYRVELRSHTISSTPVETVYQESDEVWEETVYRTGAAGHVVDVFRRFYDSDDNFVREELIGRTTYRMVTRIILIPIPGAFHPEPPPPPPYYGGGGEAAAGGEGGGE